MKLSIPFLPDSLNHHQLYLVGIFTLLLMLYVPTFHYLWQYTWTAEDQQHGPIILAISLYLLFIRLPNLSTLLSAQHFSFKYLPILLIGCVFYIIGKSQGIDFIEVGSLIPVLSGLILIFLGPSTFKRMLFPILFLCFLIPLPGTIIDQITQPLKIAVSTVVEWILYYAGFPIARNGVILQIGQYSLLVADACAGLHTIFALEAMCLLYLNLVNRHSIIRNIAMAICVVPISFLSNVIRVISICLVTYYFGDHVGQSFLHDFAGLLLFTIALLLIIGLDHIIQTFIRHNPTPESNPHVQIDYQTRNK